jgi:hypothetical protein
MNIESRMKSIEKRCASRRRVPGDVTQASDEELELIVAESEGVDVSALTDEKLETIAAEGFDG